MLRVWQKKLLIKQTPIDVSFDTAGTHTASLEPGEYDIWLVGGGGGGALWTLNNTSGVKHYAMGGVGGVLHVRVLVLNKTNITVNVGSAGTSRYGVSATTGYTVSGLDGSATSITGLSNANLVAGAGSKASVTVTSTTTTNRYPGSQGTNTATGSNVLAVLENNVNTIVSGENVSSATSSGSTCVPNINWPANTDKGRGGGLRWESNRTTMMSGGPGFVRIKSFE